MATTSDFFQRALGNEDSFGGEKGVLRFPDDNSDAWDALLFWRLQKENPTSLLETYSMRQLVHSWSLGDKYGVVDFQDLAMLELIKQAQDNYIPLHCITLAFEVTPAISPMRAFMAREACITIWNGSYDKEEYKILSETDGVLLELLSAFEDYMRKRSDDFNELIVDHKYKDDCQEFMVGDGPKNYWRPPLEDDDD